MATDAGEELAIPAERTHALRPAYAISVHRSQGCEMPVVVVPVHSGHGGMLSRNLLYTAVTRARTACVLVGQRAAVARAVGARRRLPAQLAPGRPAGVRREAADRIRTDDPVFTRDVLYQLSYGGVGGRHRKCKRARGKGIVPFPRTSTDLPASAGDDHVERLAVGTAWSRCRRCCAG